MRRAERHDRPAHVSVAGRQQCTGAVATVTRSRCTLAAAASSPRSPPGQCRWEELGQSRARIGSVRAREPVTEDRHRIERHGHGAPVCTAHPPQPVARASKADPWRMAARQGWPSSPPCVPCAPRLRGPSDRLAATASTLYRRRTLRQARADGDNTTVARAARSPLRITRRVGRRGWSRTAPTAVAASYPQPSDHRLVR